MMLVDAASIKDIATYKVQVKAMLFPPFEQQTKHFSARSTDKNREKRCSNDY